MQQKQNGKYPQHVKLLPQQKAEHDVPQVAQLSSVKLFPPFRLRANISEDIRRFEQLNHKLLKLTESGISKQYRIRFVCPFFRSSLDPSGCDTVPQLFPFRFTCDFSIRFLLSQSHMFLRCTEGEFQEDQQK